jgi:transposase
VGNLWQLWVFHSQQAVVYLLRSTRSAKVPLDYFDEQIKGILVVDRYSAYKKLARLYPGLTLAFCWAHLRRDFLDCATKWPRLQDWAFEWVERVNEIFHINNGRRKAFFSGRDYQEEDQHLRQQIGMFKEQVDQERSESDVPAGKRSVLESLNNHWEGLTVFVDQPEVPMDNNGSERVLRLSKLIVKNSYGCMSDWSVQLTETLLSIFATLQLWKINPRIWLTDYLEACANNYGKVPENSNEYLPWKMQPGQLEYFQKATSQAFDSS